MKKYKKILGGCLIQIWGENIILFFFFFSFFLSFLVYVVKFSHNPNNSLSLSN